MVFALVHFTVGFLAVLAVLCLLPITRYRLTGAYLGGVWALGPDAHHLIDGSRGEWIDSLHTDPVADIFFFHHTLDGAVFRAHNIELTFLASAALGLAFVLYDWRFGHRRLEPRRRDSTTETTDIHQSD